MTEMVDEFIGKVFEKLIEAGQDLDDWVVVFTCDHGEMLGEHGIWAKHKFYESSARVPLVIRYPKRFKATNIKENVNLCDLYATLCDICGIETPDGLDSRSLVGLMEGENDGWDNESISQYAGKHIMIKRDNLKYQYYGEDMPEVLFDLEKNPSETINFIDDPSYEDELKAFRDRRGDLGFGLNAVENYVNAGYK